MAQLKSMATNKTKLFLSQFSIRSYDKAQNNTQKPSYSSQSKSKSRARLSYSSAFNSHSQTKQLNHYQQQGKSTIFNKTSTKYCFLPNINKLRYLNNEVLDTVLSSNEYTNPMIMTDLNEENNKFNQAKTYKRSKTNRKTTIANELTKDNTIEQEQVQEDTCALMQINKLFLANISKTKRNSLYKRLNSINAANANEASSNSGLSQYTFVRRSSLADRFALRLIHPNDCIEEYVDDKKPGDTYQRLKLQIGKQKDKMTKLKLDLQRTHNDDKESLRRYVNTLKRQKTLNN